MLLSILGVTQLNANWEITNYHFFVYGEFMNHKKKYYYVVKKGHKPGIYDTWAECQVQILGYSAAIYRKFSNYEQALFFYQEPNHKARVQPIHYDLVTTNYAAVIEQLQHNEIVVFVDGSFEVSQQHFSYGVVLLVMIQGLVHIWTCYQGSNYAPFLSAHNVAGELCGTIVALKYVQKHFNNSVIHIYHDYSGISAWANGTWKANSKVAVWYLQQLQVYQQVIKHFHKVKAHSNCLLNDWADLCAKKGLNTKQNWKLVKIISLQQLQLQLQL